MKPSLEIISSNSGKMTPFMKLYWEQQKRLFTPSSSWARYHPVIICFCLSLAAFCLGASTQHKHLMTSK